MATTIKIHIADGEDRDSSVDLAPDGARDIAQLLDVIVSASAALGRPNPAAVMLTAASQLRSAFAAAGYSPR